MADVIISIKLMPDSPEIDLSKVQDQVQEKVLAFTGKTQDCRFEKKPVAFGLESLNIMFLMNEDIGATDDLEADLTTIEGVQSVDVTDVRRALG